MTTVVYKNRDWNINFKKAIFRPYVEKYYWVLILKIRQVWHCLVGGMNDPREVKIAQNYLWGIDFEVKALALTFSLMGVNKYGRLSKIQSGRTRTREINSVFEASHHSYIKHHQHKIRLGFKSLGGNF